MPLEKDKETEGEIVHRIKGNQALGYMNWKQPGLAIVCGFTVKMSLGKAHSHGCCLLYPCSQTSSAPQAGTVLAGAPAAVPPCFKCEIHHWEAGQLSALSLLRVLGQSARFWLILPWEAALLPTSCHQLLGRDVFSSQPWFPAQLSIRLKTLHFFSKCLLKVNVWSSRTKTKARTVICFQHWLPSVCTILSQGKKIGSSHLHRLAEGAEPLWAVQPWE